jgi:hypothetical protein
MSHGPNPGWIIISQKYIGLEEEVRDAAGATQGCPFDSIDTIFFVTMMKRE